MNPASDRLSQWLAEAQAKRSAASLQRNRIELSQRSAGKARAGGRDLVNFSGNDYLGLATEPALVEALAEAAREHGVGSGASALVSGYNSLHARLEQSLADHLGTEAALLFPSGYHANLAVQTSLASKGDFIVQDRLCHASLIDGARLSGARLLRYPHCDIKGLERQLELADGGQVLVVSDGVFSMDGDIAPLAGIADCCTHHNACLVVDDAHGTGVLGHGGRGSFEHLGVPVARIPVLIGTLGKAFGISGAYVAGSAALIDHLVNHARTYLYTTAMPPPLAAAGLKALEIIQKEVARRDALQRRIGQFRKGAAARGLKLLESETPIQALVIGQASAALETSQRLREQGFLVVAIRPPTVPDGTARLRITLSAAHTGLQVEGLLGALEQCL
ncbi:MAG: 8-amino-7-oxononanoate synthase [Xanthomonadales bacterium]|nr:8-amino-7-oxononanoate synthase [Gammaproteobacteria bacterium]NNE04193.1 8-amino-7-oxononanoate synthase [Xanthomonadales bacterium]NNL96058.1 8-amino-7-oxononanoate synthase [Xanthomonadales bacterium]